MSRSVNRIDGRYWSSYTNVVGPEIFGCFYMLQHVFIVGDFTNSAKQLKDKQTIAIADIIFFIS